MCSWLPTSTLVLNVRLNATAYSFAYGYPHANITAASFNQSSNGSGSVGLAVQNVGPVSGNFSIGATSCCYSNATGSFCQNSSTMPFSTLPNTLTIPASANGALAALIGECLPPSQLVYDTTLPSHVCWPPCIGNKLLTAFVRCYAAPATPSQILSNCTFTITANGLVDASVNLTAAATFPSLPTPAPSFAPTPAPSPAASLNSSVQILTPSAAIPYAFNSNVAYQVSLCLAVH